MLFLNIYLNDLYYNFDNVSFKEKKHSLTLKVYKMNIKTILSEEYVNFVDNTKKQNKNMWIYIILLLLIVLILIILLFKYINE